MVPPANVGAGFSYKCRSCIFSARFLSTSCRACPTWTTQKRRIRKVQLQDRSKTFSAARLEDNRRRYPVVLTNASSVAPSVEAAKELVKDIDFDVGLSIALAGCAFEAYNDPTGVAPDLREIAVNGTAVTFINQDFLESRVRGVLEIQLKGAKNLAARDVWGTSDPYAVLTVGPSSHTSKVVDRSLDPEWDESFVLFVRNPEKDLLRIKVNDKDLIGSDDGIGYAVIPLRAFKIGEQVDLDVPLDGNNAQGSVQLSVKYSPLTEKLADDSSGELSTVPDADALSNMAKAWRALAEISGQNTTFDPLCFIENTHSETQAWIGVDREGDGIVVAFRGTEQVKWQDFLTDLNVVPTSFNVERAPESRGGLGSLFFKAAGKKASGGQAGSQEVKDVDPEFAGASRKGSPLEAMIGMLGSITSRDESPSEQVAQSWVHSGFVTAYDSVKARIMSLVDEVMDQKPEAEWTVYVTGHSLGGALATLSAFDFATRTPRGKKKPRVVMYNYGAPRVGNKVFAEAYNQEVPDSWRVVNTKDVIPRVPRLMGYSHVGRSIALKEDGSLEIDASDEIFDEGSVIEDVVPDLANEALAVASELAGAATEIAGAAKDGAKEVASVGSTRLKRLINHELDFFNSFVDGSALLQHFEDFYLAFFRGILGLPLEEPADGGPSEGGPPANAAPLVEADPSAKPPA
eukprot:jgi/Botrbrau1/12970/Bobra.154_2s0020.4